MPRYPSRQNPQTEANIQHPQTEANMKCMHQLKSDTVTHLLHLVIQWTYATEKEPQKAK